MQRRLGSRGAVGDQLGCGDEIDQPLGEVELEPGRAEADQVHALGKLGGSGLVPRVAPAKQNGAVAAIEVDIALAVLGGELGAGRLSEDHRPRQPPRRAGSTAGQQALVNGEGLRVRYR